MADDADVVEALLLEAEGVGVLGRSARAVQRHLAVGDSVTIRPPSARGTSDPTDVTLTEHDRVLLVLSHFMWPELAIAIHRHRDRDAGEAAVSKHLKVLHKSGWITPERHSYYVYYRLETDARNRVVSGLDRVLESGD